MKRQITRSIATLGLCSLPFASGAQQAFVACPVQRLETEVTTRLPSEWWATPQEGGLLGTEIQDIAGQPALVCRYHGHAAGVSVMRRMPPGYASCAAVTGGFDCSREPRAQRSSATNATPVTQASSNAQIPTRSSNDVKLTTTQTRTEAPTASQDVAPSTTQSRAEAPAAGKQAAQNEALRVVRGKRVSNANPPLPDEEPRIDSRKRALEDAP
jgi:hypothetical protein